MSIEPEATTQTIGVSISDSTIDSITCYRDRAEVDRILTISHSDFSAGTYELIIDGLTSKTDEDSIRVSSLSSSFSILEVSSSLHHKSVDDDDDTSPIGKARGLRDSKREEHDEEKSNLSRIQERDKLLTGFLTTNLVTKESTRSPDEVLELLKFHQTAGKSNDKELRDSKKAVAKAEKALRAAEKQYNEIAFGVGDSGRDSTMSSRTVSILFSAQEGAPEELQLKMTYIVRGASWSPSYDIRVTSSAKEKALLLTYYGKVCNATGEDWNSCNLSLSTATPSVGGNPPAPPTKTVGWKRFHVGYGGGGSRGMRMKKGAAHSRPQMQQQMAPAARPAMAAPERRYSFEAEEAYDESDDDELFGGGMVADTSVSDAGGGSSTFKIVRKTAIASDSKEHKVSIAMINLDPDFRYFLTPSIEAKAYTQCRTINKSAFTFLEGPASVFMEGSFVCHSLLKNVLPNESFSVFLGTDTSLKVSHKLLKKSTKQGEQGGYMTRDTKTTQSFYYNTKLTNNKNEAVTITLVEVLPRTEVDKIKVVLNEPTEEALTKSQSSDAEGQLAVGTVMRNKVTNNIVFSKRVEAGEKIDVPFSYTINSPDRKSVV